MNGGHRLVAWGQIKRLIDLGRMGILDLEVIRWALIMRWLQLKKT